MTALAADPRTGEITEISDAIREQIEWYKVHRPENHCGRDINAGYCDEFAREIAYDYPGLERDGNLVEIWSTGFFDADENGMSDLPAHAFVKWKGKYYDAEDPNGVEDWRDLPLYRRWRKPEDGDPGHEFKFSDAQEGEV